MSAEIKDVKKFYEGTPDEKLAEEAIESNIENGYAYIKNPKTKEYDPFKLNPWGNTVINNAKDEDVHILLMVQRDYESFCAEWDFHSASGQNFEGGDMVRKNTKENSVIAKIAMHDKECKRIKRYKNFRESKVFKENSLIMSRAEAHMLGKSFRAISGQKGSYKKVKGKRKIGCHHNSVKNQIVTTAFKVVCDWYRANIDNQ